MNAAKVLFGLVRLCAVVACGGCNNIPTATPAVSSASTFDGSKNGTSVELASGYCAYIELGRNAAWMKVELHKTDWDVGEIRSYLARTRKDLDSVSPNRIFKDKLDPCLISIAEEDATIIVSGGTSKSSYISFVPGSNAAIREIKKVEQRP